MLLQGKRGLIFGVANEHSLAWHIALAARAQGAELIFSVASERFLKRVAPMAAEAGAPPPVLCDVADDAEIARAAEQMTLTYLGAVRAVPSYNVMGVAKAALESAVRYLANDLGPAGVRVNAISAGPVKTLSASIVKGFKDKVDLQQQAAPLRRNVTGSDVGNAGLFLLSELASGVTGQVLYVDCGYSIMADFLTREANS
jgi:enoyl-[acyl-carrier-protein] reductase (NADH)